ncbi:MAG: Hsp70 family protein [Armatimonadota bacterium]|nr:Hsp70 family protein [Armatimonadota bacterium]
MPIIGIDLGTTFSAVAVPGAREGERFEVHGDVSVICDQHGRYAVPSVVGLDRNGEVIVGHRAKAQAGLTPGPIMFVKRYMGGDRTFRLGDRELQPQEVSAHVLRHLKRMAEEALGEPVEQAVITVPAWFNLLAKDRTEEAGELAELEVVRVAQEPVAAALAYFREWLDEESGEGPETILTYDLGGGTFDAAVVSRATGVPEVLSSRGDPFLGGYNFDRRLALLITERLCEQDYALDLDPDEEKDALAWAKLLVLAERAKIELSREAVHVMQEPSTGIVDHEGVPVTIDLEIPRSQFTERIAPLIDRTMQLCQAALTTDDGEEIPRESIDEVIMVGGSSRIPMVSERIEEEFGIVPELLDPDLCVAIGAAVLAAGGPLFSGQVRLDRAPEETDQRFIQVTGSVLPDGEETDLAGWRVELARADGGYSDEQTTGEAGGFAFLQAPLAEGRDNEFRLRVFDLDGEEHFSHQFTVKQTAEPRAGDVISVPDTNRLAKPIILLTADGRYTAARAGTNLPFSCTITAETTTTGILRVPVQEGATKLGECVVENIPPEVPVGTGVEIHLEISRNYEAVTRAYIPAIAMEDELRAGLTPPPRKTIEELRSEFAALEVRAGDALRTATPGELFQDGRGDQIQEVTEHIREEFESGHPDPDRTQELVSELGFLVDDLAAVWEPDPSRPAYDRLVAEIERLLEEAEQADATVRDYGYRERFAALCDAAEEAFAEKNDTGWRRSVEDLRELKDQLRGIIGGGGGTDQMEPGAMILALGQHLEGMREDARKQGLEAELDECVARLREIRARDSDAMADVSALYVDRVQPLEQKLKGRAPTGEKGWIRITGEDQPNGG